MCKKKSGETFELKEIIELQNYQLRDEISGEKDNKKVFLLAPLIPASTSIHKANCANCVWACVCMCINSGPICSCSWTAMGSMGMIYSSKQES